MHVLVVFGNGEGLLFMSFYTMMLMSARVTYITLIAQVTLKIINNTLLIYIGGFVSLTFSSCSIFRLTNKG